jgi:hypothetical protein
MLLASFESAFVYVSIVAVGIIASVIWSVSKDKARIETMKKLREDDSLAMCSKCGGVGVKGMLEKTCETCKGRGCIKSPTPPSWLVQNNEPEDDPAE